MTTSSCLLPVAAALSLLAGSAAAQDAARGRTAFSQCGGCHAIQPGVNRVGPSLAGVVGRPVGRAPNYHYSPALARANQRWSPALLARWLTNPNAVFPGNKMVIAVHDPRARADIIAYLASPAVAGQHR